MVEQWNNVKRNEIAGERKNDKKEMGCWVECFSPNIPIFQYSAVQFGLGLYIIPIFHNSNVPVLQGGIHDS